MKSNILWTTLATGKAMDKHGIVGWTSKDESGVGRLTEGTGRRVRTYWEILDERGLATTTVNWWLSHPPPLESGALVSDAFRDLAEPQTVHPPGLFDRLRASRPRGPRAVREEWGDLGLADYTLERATTAPQGIAVQTIGAHRAYLYGDLIVDHASDELWDARPAVVFSTYFRFVDVTSHFGVHFVKRSDYDATADAERDGELTDQARERIDAAMARAVLPAYEPMDRIVGKYLSRLDDRTLLVICSDHGFAWHRGVFDHTKQEQDPPPGVLLLAGPGVRSGVRLQGASLLDVAPTLLYALGQPVARDMDGQVLRDAFTPRWQERFPVQTVRTYETGPRRKGTTRPHGQLDERRLEDLRSLGYIDVGGSEGRD